MAKRVALSVFAEEDYTRVVTYLASEWGYKVLLDFIRRYEKIILILEEDAIRYPFADG